jgi:ribulose kinase
MKEINSEINHTKVIDDTSITMAMETGMQNNLACARWTVDAHPGAIPAHHGHGEQAFIQRPRALKGGP